MRTSESGFRRGKIESQSRKIRPLDSLLEEVKQDARNRKIPAAKNVPKCRAVSRKFTISAPENDERSRVILVCLLQRVLECADLRIQTQNRLFGVLCMCYSSSLDARFLEVFSYMLETVSINVNYIQLNVF
uniref:Uncharacterized protein n=1 Tax=Spironucleus salmonicida TaxID=348837 RepID=V6LU82_9EUKA|eukprot:EST44364.1 Hypothetical protein SS50377_15795 [Spironucleus salmonicida]